MIKPLHPSVTLDEFLAFDAARPETHTSSPVVNAVAEALAVVRPMTERYIAHYLRVDGKKLSYALEIITGHGFTALRYYWLEHRYAQITQANPKISKSELAHQLGFATSSSLWHLLHSPGFKAKKRLNVRKDADTEAESRRRHDEELERWVRVREMRINKLKKQANNGDESAKQMLKKYYGITV